MLSQAFSFIMDCGISAPVHVREVLYGLNATDKTSLLQLISTVQFPGAKGYETQITIHPGTPNYDVSLSK